MGGVPPGDINVRMIRIEKLVFKTTKLRSPVDQQMEHR